MINDNTCCVVVVELTFLAGDVLKDSLISSLPKTLFTPTLTCLLLAHTLLTELSDGLFTLSNLQTLDVSFNSLAIIPPSISQLTSLVKVNLGFNKIKEVPNELFRIPTLTHLIPSHNKLTSLPSDPAMSPNCELSLGFVDPLSKSMIYEKTGTGTHPGAVLCPLERLLLASTQLTSVPPPVLQFRKLHTLSLSGNGISELPRPFFRSLPNLSRLDLSFNELTHLLKLDDSGNTKRISLDFAALVAVAVSPPAILRNMHSTHPSHTDTGLSRRTDTGQIWESSPIRPPPTHNRDARPFSTSSSSFAPHCGIDTLAVTDSAIALFFERTGSDDVVAPPSICQRWLWMDSTCPSRICCRGVCLNQPLPSVQPTLPLIFRFAASQLSSSSILHPRMLMLFRCHTAATSLQPSFIPNCACLTARLDHSSLSQPLVRFSSTLRLLNIIPHADPVVVVQQDVSLFCSKCHISSDATVSK
ncbi:putative leucine-rich repeat protein [Blattamonas nauphoetae]|uniref:Leucine-rich repeat protein n=1 Tax=Blattamonas nauphoetae TaxID=2049346 RepID=A0ABQ9YDF9_9EUKA|nr:putative leucine-rich repeat protein [Blattamonas nauphoetae]